MPSPQIQSLQNPKIKLARSLWRNRRARREHGLFIVEGLRHVGAALDSETEIAYLLWAPERLTSEFGQHLVEQAAQELPVYTTSGEVLDSISGREHSQGLVAVAKIRTVSLEAITPRHHGWVVAVMAPQNPGNIGTLLRTMDAVGTQALFLLEGGADPYHPTSVRASMGALFWIPIVSTSWENFLAWARSHSYHLYGSSARGTVAFPYNGYTKPAALLLGNERHGLSPSQQEACEAVIALPMEGHGTSLNLAVAAGVLLYDMRPRLTP